MSLGLLLAYVPVFVLVLFRLAGIMMFAPLLSGARTPRRLKIAIALVLAMTICPSINPLSLALPQTTWGMALGIGGELIFGVAMGTIVSFVFIAAQWAGDLIGQQMGLNISEVVDPNFSGASTVMSDLYYMLTMMVFISPAVHGDRSLIRGVGLSFKALPLMSVTVDRNLLDTIVGLLQSSAALAIQLAAPILMTMLIVDLVLGCIGKAMPQMNVMAVGMSLRSLLGVFVLVIGLKLTVYVLANMNINASLLCERFLTTPVHTSP